MNYGQIKTRVDYNIGRGVGAQRASELTAQIDLFAQQSIQDIITWREGWFLEGQALVTMVAGTQAYDLPDDYKGNMKMLIRESSRWVELKGPIDVVEASRRFAPDSVGKPTAWSHSGEEQFKVWPVSPDGGEILQLNYIRYIDNLVNDSDENIFTKKYPSMLIAKMTEWGFRYLQEHGDAKEWEVVARAQMDNAHAAWVAAVMGRDFSLAARPDVFGTNEDMRGGTFITVR